MSKTRKKKRPPKRVLALPDLEHAKSAVLNTLTSKSGQRTYDHAITEFVEWYCSEPRLAFNRTVVLRYRINLEQKQYAPSTINLRLAAVRRLAYEAADGWSQRAMRRAQRVVSDFQRVINSFQASVVDSQEPTRPFWKAARRCGRPALEFPTPVRPYQRLDVRSRR